MTMPTPPGIRKNSSTIKCAMAAVCIVSFVSGVNPNCKLTNAITPPIHMIAKRIWLIFKTLSPVVPKFFIIITLFANAKVGN